MFVRRLRFGAPLALVFALWLCPTASDAQSFWDDIFRKPAPRAASTPCVLDKCLNGGGQKSASPPGSSSAPTNSPLTPPSPSAGAIAPGDFDFYLLTLSWSPGFCATGGADKSPEQCSAGANLGFVVHGLWPQFQRGYPSDCDPSRPVSRIALEATRGVFPSESLARYEWRKHGTCTGLSPEAYFASVRRARASIVIPNAFVSPREEQSISPSDLQRAFLSANPGLRLSAMAIGCRSGQLQEVRLCLSKDLRQFVNCPEVARATCRSPSIDMAPVQ
jgi:ribonuclease T2